MRARLHIWFPDAAQAAAAAAALEPDNHGFLTGTAAGDTVLLQAEGETLGVLRSLDDALGCLRALETE